MESKLRDWISKGEKQDILTFVITQCHRGSVFSFEKNSAKLLGAINCGDMVPPAVFAKVSQILEDPVV